MITLPKQSGFSLVETLVAVTILLVIVVGPMRIVSNATFGSNFSNEQVVGFFLAQEGAELAQKSRDDLLLEHFLDGFDTSGWNAFTDPSGDYAACFTTQGCGLYIDTSDDGSVVVEQCSTGDCRLTLDATNNTRDRYTHDGSGDVTIYNRVITMTETVADQEVAVVSTVTWRTGNQFREQQAEVRTYLYNVYDR